VSELCLTKTTVCETSHSRAHNPSEYLAAPPCVGLEPIHDVGLKSSIPREGRAGVLAHGDRKMSVWGERYWATAMSEYGPEEFNEQRAQNRVRELVVYLEAIQE